MVTKNTQPASGILLATVMAIVAYVMRYYVIEPDINGIICEANEVWWCLPRTALIIATQWQLFGGTALVLMVISLLMIVKNIRYAQHLAMLAMALSGAGLLLYNANFSVIAVVITGLILANYE